MKKFLGIFGAAWLVLCCPAHADDVPKVNPNVEYGTSGLPMPSQARPNGVVLILSPAQAQALIDFIDVGVRTGGLAKAEAAAELYSIIKKAAQDFQQAKQQEPKH